MQSLIKLKLNLHMKGECVIMKKTWTPREFAKLLRKNGYEFDHGNGDHMIYRNASGRPISFNTRGNGLNRMVAQRLIKEYGLVVA